MKDRISWTPLQTRWPVCYRIGPFALGRDVIELESRIEALDTRSRPVTAMTERGFVWWLFPIGEWMLGLMMKRRSWRSSADG